MLRRGGVHARVVRPITGRTPAPSDVGELRDERTVIMGMEMV